MHEYGYQASAATRASAAGRRFGWAGRPVFPSAAKPMKECSYEGLGAQFIERMNEATLVGQCRWPPAAV
jgi:hypothetical protein